MTGSFAAFVGVELDLKTATPSWQAIALGDTCLLHCRGGELLKSLPLSRSDSFNSAPVLVASNCALHESTMQSVVVDSGNFENGDVLLLDIRRNGFMVFAAFREGRLRSRLSEPQTTTSYADSLTKSDKLAKYETTISPSCESKSSGELTKW